MQDTYHRVGVQTCNKDPWLALLEYRNTPVDTIDPAQYRDSCLEERRCSWKTRRRRLVVKSFVATGSFSNHRNSRQQMVVWKLHTKLPSLFGVPFLAVPIQTKVSPYISDPAPDSVTNPVFDPAPDLVPHPVPVKRTRNRIFKSRLISSRT